ncbi:hypothetical protein Tco_0711511 [Tanacetum coccineum]
MFHEQPRTYATETTRGYVTSLLEIPNMSPNGVFGNEVYGSVSEGFGVNPLSNEFRFCNSDEWRFKNGDGLWLDGIRENSPRKDILFANRRGLKKLCVNKFISPLPNDSKRTLEDIMSHFVQPVAPKITRTDPSNPFRFKSRLFNHIKEKDQVDIIKTLIEINFEDEEFMIFYSGHPNDFICN